MTAFTNGRIFDGATNGLIEGRSVFVVDDRVAEVSDRPPNPGDGGMIDCGGRTLMPGLIDSHIHAYASSVNFYDVSAMSETLAAC